MRMRTIFQISVLLFLVGCQPSKNQKSTESETTDTFYKTLYEEQLKQTNEEITKFNDMLDRAYKGNRMIVDSGVLIQDIDQKAAECRAMVADLRDKMSVLSAQDIQAKLRTVKSKVEEGVAAVGKLENLFSKDALKKLKDDVNSTIRSDSREKARSLYEAQSRLLSQMSGLREVFLGMYNDLIPDANRRLSSFRNEQSAPVPSVTRAPVEETPVVENSAEGGKVRGVIQHSQTGAPIPDALVGFKRQAESQEHFYETHTQNDGSYQSPYLRPGKYYLDVYREGFIDLKSQEVDVSVGRINNENRAISPPVGAGKFRIVMSWCNLKAGAVKDVDSYLAIPGTSIPLAYPNRGRQYFGAHLDRDDVDWSGPETITIHNITQGTYVYYVNNFDTRNNQTALGHSDIRVNVYKGSELVRTYSVPEGSGLDYEVFRIEDGQIVDVERYNSALYHN
jgi:hypothetical protein